MIGLGFLTILVVFILVIAVRSVVNDGRLGALFALFFLTAIGSGGFGLACWYISKEIAFPGNQIKLNEYVVPSLIICAMASSVAFMVRRKIRK